MRIRMKGTVAGLRDGADWPKVGEEMDVPDDEGAALCANGMAEPIVTDDTEKAVAPEGEKRKRSIRAQAGVAEGSGEA